MINKKNECIVCNSDSEFWFSKINQYGSYNIYKCSNCKTAFVSPRPPIKYLNDFYCHKSESTKSVLEITVEEKNYPNSTIDAKRIINNLIALKENNSGLFLDVGAGFGFFSKEAKDKALEVVSLEVGNFEVSTLKELWGINALKILFEDFIDDEKKFSYILMSQILEHTLSPETFIQKAFRLLEADGIICIAVPNFNSFFRYVLGKRDIFITPPEHLNFFTPKGLEILLMKNGFEIIKLDFISRLPFSSRLSRNIVRTSLNFLENLFCKTIYRMSLGMFINIYARKIE